MGFLARTGLRTVSSVDTRLSHEPSSSKPSVDQLTVDSFNHVYNMGRSPGTENSRFPPDKSYPTGRTTELSASGASRLAGLGFGFSSRIDNRLEGTEARPEPSRYCRRIRKIRFSKKNQRTSCHVGSIQCRKILVGTILPIGVARRKRSRSAAGILRHISMTAVQNGFYGPYRR